MDSEVCVWLVLCEGREGLIFEVDILCLYVHFEDCGFSV